MLKEIAPPNGCWFYHSIDSVRAVIPKQKIEVNQKRFVFYQNVPQFFEKDGISEKVMLVLSFDEIEYLYEQTKELKLNQILLGD